MYASMYGGLNQIPEDQEEEAEIAEEEEEDVGEPKAKR
jgi:hypothetical protein